MSLLPCVSSGTTHQPQLHSPLGLVLPLGLRPLPLPPHCSAECLSLVYPVLKYAVCDRLAIPRI